MLEQRRLDYLKAMGITQWMPRQPLPHAPEPRWLPTAANDGLSADAVTGQNQEREPVSAASILTSQTVSTPTSVSVPTSVPTPTPTQAQPIASGPVNTVVEQSATATQPASIDLTPPNFRLEFVRVSNTGIWVGDEATDAAQLMRFAHRVMRGMGQPIEVFSEQAPFVWPYMNSRHLDQSEPVAVQALISQWQFLQSQGVQYCVAFGEQAQNWLGKIKASESQIELVTFSSLQQCMTEATEKRRLWQHLLRISNL